MFPTITIDDTLKGWHTIGTWLKARANGKAQKPPHDRVLMDCILSAATDTAAYNETLTSPASRNRYAELALSNEWYEVATLLLREAGQEWQSRELGLMCRDKGFYWAEMDAWTPERIKAAGRELAELREEVRRVAVQEKYQPLQCA